LFSFHEFDPMILGGGDTLLRNIGFILLIAPSSPTMSAWPYRLLLWQMIALYTTSFWYKLLGHMWMDGTAVLAALHHPVFSRFPPAIVNMLMPVLPLIDYTSLIW